MVSATVRVSLILVALVITLSVANGQTVRDTVKDHVDKELDKPRDDKKRNKRRPAPRNNTTRDRDSASGTTYTLTLGDDPELVRPGRRLPLRLFPNAARYVSVNLKLDAAYRGWLPQQYASADVDIGSYFTWSVAIRGKFFRRVTLHRAYYESNGLAAPRTRNAAVASQVGKHSPKAAKALAYLGVPVSQSWQPIVRYESQAFNTVATPNIPVCIVGRKTSTSLMDCPRTMGKLRVISSFETFVAGVRYSSQRSSRSFLATQKGRLPPLYFGVGLMSYSKPYQVTVDGNTLEDFLFDGRFRGAGLAMGTSVGGGPRRFFAHVDLQLGLGEVSLTEDLTLNEVAPDDWLIGYIQGNLRAGYRLVVFDGPPTVYLTPTLGVGGASFHFVRTSAADGEDNNAPNVNWDLLWSTRAALEVAL